MDNIITRVTLLENANVGGALEDILRFSTGDHCTMFKEDHFYQDGRVLYIPSVEDHGIPIHSPISRNELASVLKWIYSFEDFVNITEGDMALAKEVFDQCEGEVPEDVYERIMDERNAETEKNFLRYEAVLFHRTAHVKALADKMLATGEIECKNPDSEVLIEVFILWAKEFDRLHGKESDDFDYEAEFDKFTRKRLLEKFGKKPTEEKKPVTWIAQCVTEQFAWSGFGNSSESAEKALLDYFNCTLGLDYTWEEFVREYNVIQTIHVTPGEGTHIEI